MGPQDATLSILLQSYSQPLEKAQQRPLSAAIKLKSDTLEAATAPAIKCFTLNPPSVHCVQVIQEQHVPVH